jgi:hypothetical protein
MILNEYAGRSFHEPTLYPISPWNLTSYDDGLDCLQDLSHPIAYFLGRCARFSSLSTANPIPGSFTSIQTAYCLSTPGKLAGIELCPEFFSSPEYFAGDFDLPRWS